MPNRTFTLRELEENNLQVGDTPQPTVYCGPLSVGLVHVGGNLFKLPKGWKFVDHHGYWLLSKGGK